MARGRSRCGHSRRRLFRSRRRLLRRHMMRKLAVGDALARRGAYPASRRPVLRPASRRDRDIIRLQIDSHLVGHACAFEPDLTPHRTEGHPLLCRASRRRSKGRVVEIGRPHPIAHVATLHHEQHRRLVALLGECSESGDVPRGAL